MNQQHRIGLVLSGGTLKGAAHAGAIKALHELQIPIHCVAGTSAGSLVATLYAHGYSVEEMQSLIESFPGVKLLDYGFPISSHLWYHTKKRLRHRTPRAVQKSLSVGLLRGKKLRKYVNKLIAGRTPQLPYYVVATDLNSGNPVVFSNDERATEQKHAYPITNPAEVVAASCALPGIFRSVSWEGRLLADGALRHYAPIDVLKDAGCTKIIVVNLLTLDKDWYPMTVLDVVNRAFEILLRETIDDDVEDYNNILLVEPALSHVKWTSISELEACYTEGYRAVYEKKPQLRRWLNTSEHGPDTPSVYINQHLM